MADGRHFDNRYIAISQRKSSDSHDILYTAADFELDERHVIKNEKVALDRLRVRQNVFLFSLCNYIDSRQFKMLNNISLYVVKL